MHINEGIADDGDDHYLFNDKNKDEIKRITIKCVIFECGMNSKFCACAHKRILLLSTHRHCVRLRRGVGRKPIESNDENVPGCYES